jgi:enterochelin esterase family protein
VPQPWVVPQPDVPAGSIEEHMVDSEITGHRRRVWIYTPAGYAPEKGPYPLLLLLDGQAYVACGRAPTTLDNLIAAGKIPATVCVMVSIPEDEPEARLEMYACSEEFNEFLARELMPWVRSRVAVSVDPRWNTVGGSSMGGLAAAFAGLNLYFLFGNVLSQSGSYWWRPPQYPEHEWLMRQFVLAPQRPLRFFMSVGQLETVATPGNGPTQVVSNRHMRDVLEARGFPDSYVEYNEGHNFLSWRGSLAEGLLTLFSMDEAVEEQSRDDPRLVVGVAAAESR